MKRKTKVPGYRTAGFFSLYDEILKYLPPGESTSVIISSDPGSFTMIMSAFANFEREVRY